MYDLLHFSICVVQVVTMFSLLLIFLHYLKLLCVALYATRLNIYVYRVTKNEAVIQNIVCFW